MRPIFMHLRRGNGVVTLAGVLTQMGDSRQYCSVGVAFCSPKDRFAKAKGRMIALARANKLNSQFQWGFETTGVENLREEVYLRFFNIFSAYANNPDKDHPVPNWFAKYLRTEHACCKDMGVCHAS